MTPPTPPFLVLLPLGPLLPPPLQSMRPRRPDPLIKRARVGALVVMADRRVSIQLDVSRDGAPFSGVLAAELLHGAAGVLGIAGWDGLVGPDGRHRLQVVEVALGGLGAAAAHVGEIGVCWWGTSLKRGWLRVVVVLTSCSRRELCEEEVRRIEELEVVFGSGCAMGDLGCWRVRLPLVDGWNRARDLTHIYGQSEFTQITILEQSLVEDGIFAPSFHGSQRFDPTQSQSTTRIARRTQISLARLVARLAL